MRSKAAYVLQGFATVFYVVFAIVMYVYIGGTVQPVALLSLPPIWSKIAFGIALPNFLIAGGLYIHVPAKLVFVRIFRGSAHVHSHTLLGWVTWIGLCFVGAVVAFLFSVAVPIFTFLIGLTASLFASWYGITLSPADRQVLRACYEGIRTASQDSSTYMICITLTMESKD